MTIKKTMMILAMGAAIAVSCKKKVDPTPAPATTTSGTTTSGTTTSGTTSGTTTSSTITKTSLLTNKNWKMTAFTGSINGGPNVDQFGMMDACEKDDLTKFSATSTAVKTGTFAVDVKTPCDATDSNYSGTWALNASETELTMVEDGQPNEGAFGIVELTATTLKLSKTVTVNGVTSKEIVTWTAQ